MLEMIEKNKDRHQWKIIDSTSNTSLMMEMKRKIPLLALGGREVWYREMVGEGGYWA